MFSKYPGFRPFVAVTTGILVGHYVDVAGEECLVASAFVFLSGILVSKRLLATASCFLLLSISLTVAGGLLLHAKSVSPADEDVVVGFIVGTPSNGKFATRYTLTRAGFQHMPGRKARIRLTVSATTAPQGVLPGDMIGCAGSAEIIPAIRNPGGFDYSRYLQKQGIVAAFRCDEDIAPVHLRRAHVVTRTIEKMRQTIGVRLRNHIGEKERPLFEALILGDRRDLSASTRRDFSETGLMHLLAVSGLHVMMISMSVFLGIRPILLRFRLSWMYTEVARLVGSLILLILYCLLTGQSASVVRASVMAAVFMLSNIFQRQSAAINSLSVAGLIVLLINPRQLLTAGFQLSFMAVAAIVLVVPNLNLPRPRNKFIRLLVDVSIITFAATLGTAPILLYHFGSFSLSGFILNPPGIFLTTLAMFSGIGAVVTGPSIASLFGDAGSWLANALMWLTSVGREYVRVEIVETSATPFLWLFLLLGASVFVLPRQVIRTRLGSLALLAAAAIVWFSICSGKYLPKMQVVFLDVGHGDAALIKGPCGKTLLIDAGPGSHEYSSSAETIYRTSRRMGIRSIDEVVITHPHADHLGGLLHLTKMMKIHSVLQNGRSSNTMLYSKTQQVLRSNSVTMVDAAINFRHIPAECIHIDVLGTASTLQDNDASIVLRIQYGETTFLFTGDIESVAELLLVERYGNILPADVIKVPHHGSKTSSSNTFVAAATSHNNNSIAVISAATHNRFDLPSEEVVQRWLQAGSEVLVTRSSGAVWINSDGKRIEVKRWKP